MSTSRLQRIAIASGSTLTLQGARDGERHLRLFVPVIFRSNAPKRTSSPTEISFAERKEGNVLMTFAFNRRRRSQIKLIAGFLGYSDATKVEGR